MQVIRILLPCIRMLGPSAFRAGGGAVVNALNATCFTSPTGEELLLKIP